MIVLFWGRFLVRTARPGIPIILFRDMFWGDFWSHDATSICGYFLVQILRFLGQISGADSTTRDPDHFPRHVLGRFLES